MQPQYNPELRVVHSQTAESIAAAKAARDAERAEMLLQTLPKAGSDKLNEELHDQTEIIRPGGLADVILAAEARLDKRPYTDYSDHHPKVRQEILHDATVVLRYRRAKWRLIARRKVERAIFDGLMEHASDALADKYGADKARIAAKCLAAFMAGPAYNACMETLSGRLPVSARSYAAAALGVPEAE